MTEPHIITQIAGMLAEERRLERERLWTMLMTEGNLLDDRPDGEPYFDINFKTLAELFGMDAEVDDYDE